jgi:hypothetical protein
MLEYWYQSEIRRLEIYHRVSVKAVEQYAINQIYQLTDFEKNRIIEMLDRLFINELDFLQKHTKQYFLLYR